MRNTYSQPRAQLQPRQFSLFEGSQGNIVLLEAKMGAGASPYFFSIGISDYGQKFYSSITDEPISFEKGEQS